MPSPKTLVRIEQLIWVLIYGGLFAIVLGIATHSRSGATAWSLIIAGSVVTVAGVVLIWVRSRLQAD